MATVGGVACFVVSALSYLPFIGVALWILPARLPLPRPARRARLAGLGEVLRQRHVLGPLLLVLVTGTLCAPLVTFSPVLVKDVFQGTATRFSVAMGSFGVGGLLGATALLAFKPRLDRRRLSVFAALVYGLVVVLTALNPWFWGLPVLLVLAGAAMTVSNTAASALLQGGAGPMRLGITVSLFLLALRGGLSLGSLLTGATIGVLGVQRALLADGVLALALHTAVARYWLQGEAPTDGALAATAVTPNQPRSQP
jgi:predicted MFS family arabinose efflux permease